VSKLTNRSAAQAGDDARDRRDWTTAAAQYRLHLEKKPRDFAIWVQLGHASKEQGSFVDALVAYSKAVALNPNDADLLLNLGHLYKLTGRPDTAAAYYQRSAAIDANSDAVRELQALGKVHEQPVRTLPSQLAAVKPAGVLQSALIKVLKRNGQSERARGDEARNRRDWSAAAEHYRLHVGARPSDFAIWVQLGHALKEGGRLQEALAAYSQALSIESHNADLLLNLAHLHKVLGMQDLALEFYRRSAAQDGNQNAIGEIVRFNEGASGPKGFSYTQLEFDRNGIVPGLFEGSNFEQLSIVDSRDISNIIKQSATPAEISARVSKSLYSPVISIIIPIYNTPPRFFREMLQSVFAQTYTNWEICVVDDGSSSPSTIAIFEELTQSPDPRIISHRLDVNRGIAGASHAALELAGGEYVGFLDHDDLLTPNALSEIVGLLREHSATDFIYTDHVMIDHDGNLKNYSRKPDWSPEFLLSTNYIVHFKVVRRELLLSIGGLQNEIDNVQDLGVTCALVAAGANVRHLAKPLYLWREHRSSVALSTQAKPGIEQLLLQVYDRYLRALGVAAKQTWPNVFKASRTGVFQLSFDGVPPSVALILLSRGSDEAESEIRARFANVLAPHVTLHIICLDPGSSDGIGAPIKSDEEMLEYLRSIDAEVVAFANTTAQFLGIDWVTRLAHYATIDPLVGAAGGKTVDPGLQIRSGGMLLDEDGIYRTIGGGSFDNANGHWFNGQIASNVDAIASQVMATRRSILIEMGGIGFHAFGDAAGVAYSAALRLKGYRVVYDPFSRICDAHRMAASDAAWRRIRTLGRDAAPLRIYEALGA